MTILELREKRAKAWEAAKAFLDSHRNEKGVLSAEDDAAYTRMEQNTIIQKFIHTAETLCEGTLRKPVEPLPVNKVAALFAVAYLYEHRENADMDELTRMLRYILATEREVAF